MVDLNATLVAQIINFLILVALLAKFAYKPLLAALEERKSRIAGEMEAAEKEKKSAEQLKADLQQQLNEARIQAQAIMDKAVKQAEETQQEMLTAARADIDRERKQAREEIVREREKALTDIRSEVVVLSMAAASKIIAKNLDDESNAQLVNDFIDKLDEKKIGGLSC